MIALFKNKKKAVPPPDAVEEVAQSSGVEKPASLQEAGAAEAEVVATKKKKSKKNVVKKGFFRDDQPGERALPHPDQELRRHRRLVRRIVVQSLMITVLALVDFAAVPVLRPTLLYYVRRIDQPLGTERRIMGLEMPILTQNAILSWSSTAVTEIMTFNFADYNQRLSLFSDRFLPESWVKFVDALLKQDVINKFKHYNLVLTAAPSAPAIIVSEGIDEKTGDYQWVVQVPVILNYVTNNNKNTRSSQLVELTLVRVSTLENPYGIAIKTWWAR
jgi:hypothetical protein